MPFWMYLLPTALGLQFGGAETWATRPCAKILVIARGSVSPAYVQQHLAEVKASVRVMMSAHPRLEESAADVTVEIKRTLDQDDMEASVSTSVIMSMTAAAQMFP